MTIPNRPRSSHLKTLISRLLRAASMTSGEAVIRLSIGIGPFCKQQPYDLLAAIIRPA